MDVQASYEPAHARGLRVIYELPDGTEVDLPPLGLDQIADCLRLDPQEGAPAETGKQLILRMQRQAKRLLGPRFEYLTGVLPPDRVGELMSLLYLAASGIEGSDFVAVQRYRAEQAANQRSSADLAREVDGLILALAAELKVTTAQAGAIPPADAVSQHARLIENADHERRFMAALHGIPP